MLAYAARRPRIGARHSSPNAMLAVIALHVGVLAVVMSVKMDLPHRIIDPPIDVTFVPTPKVPPPNQPVRPQQTHQPTFTQPQTQVAFPAADPEISIPTPSQPNFDSWPGGVVNPPPRVDPIPAPVRTAARLLTPVSELKPPYPQSKLLTEEEATLKLRLTIDERGRVIAVEPIGEADRAFLDAARRYLLAHWRYQPASEGGRPLTSTEVITLRFQLDG